MEMEMKTEDCGIKRDETKLRQMTMTMMMMKCKLS